MLLSHEAEARVGPWLMLSRMVANYMILGCGARVGRWQAWPDSPPPTWTGLAHHWSTWRG